MRIQFLQRLTNCAIVHFDSVEVANQHDYWDLVTDTYSIGFFNPLYYGKSPDCMELVSVDHPPSLAGDRITQVIYKKGEHLLLRLQGGGNLLLSVRPEDFHGPEAAEVNFHSGEIVIFDQDE